MHTLIVCLDLSDLASECHGAAEATMRTCGSLMFHGEIKHWLNCTTLSCNSNAFKNSDQKLANRAMILN